MAKNTKNKKSSSCHQRCKSGSETKKAIDQLSAFIAKTRDDQNAYYAELQRLLTQRRRTPKSEADPDVAAVLEIFKIGPSVFESRKHFLSWLNRPSVALWRKTPIRLMLTKKAEFVRDELLRIEYGVLS